MTTYREGNFSQTSHAEINSMWDMVRKQTEEDWIIDEYEVTEITGPWYWRTYNWRKIYRVCVGIGGIEYQVINFETEDGEGTTHVPAHVVTAFLYGVLAGFKAGQDVAARTFREATQVSEEHLRHLGHRGSQTVSDRPTPNAP